MLKGFNKNMKATRGPCPCLDSFSWEVRHNTAQCGVCFRTGTPLRFKGFQFPVLVIKEGNPKCLLCPPSWPALLLLAHFPGLPFPFPRSSLCSSFRLYLTKAHLCSAVVCRMDWWPSPNPAPVFPDPVQQGWEQGL